jgi:DNA modification methylase
MVCMSKKNTYQTLITRLPYASKYDPKPILEAAKLIDARGLISISIPMHTEHPNNGGELIAELEKAGLILVAKIAWHRDRHIVTGKRRLTNAWEPIAIFAKAKNYIINRDAPSKTKKGFENRETSFDEDEYKTCIGDFWPIRNDRADRRWLPQLVVLNCAQLADLQPGDTIYDPYGNPGVKKAAEAFDWKYKDGNLPSETRNSKAQPQGDSN